MLPSLVEKAEKNKGGKPTKVLEGGFYDSKNNFNYLAKREIEPVIKTRKKFLYEGKRISFES